MYTVDELMGIRVTSMRHQAREASTTAKKTIHKGGRKFPKIIPPDQTKNSLNQVSRRESASHELHSKTNVPNWTTCPPSRFHGAMVPTTTPGCKSHACHAVHRVNSASCLRSLNPVIYHVCGFGWEGRVAPFGSSRYKPIYLWRTSIGDKASQGTRWRKKVAHPMSTVTRLIPAARFKAMTHAPHLLVQGLGTTRASRLSGIPLS
ncbi:hypothetical protein L210DRAFT_932603 [Boletus edulis BED1]|uniref:Uncharacterized protein n=1 Tax=Boletus edulis BED1 TaxID=1328754 RepID=A0AAD4BJS7_BOLED|nr:hypothetical protein L210DRAFT_932603 [Boletus edulis BED1]